MNKTEKKVLVISNMYPGRLSKTYGVFVRNQVEALKNCGLNVDVIAISDPRTNKILVLKKYLSWLLKALLTLVVKGKQYDVVHAHYVFPSGLFGLLFKRLYKTKLVITAHGGDIDKMSKKGPFFFNNTKKILHASNHVIAVGEELKREIKEVFGVSDNKISVINMGVNREVFTPLDKKLAKKETGLSTSNFHLLFVGNYIKEKGLIELIDAFNILKKTHSNLELHFIGSIKQESFIKQLHQKIKKEEIEDINIHPAMNQKEIASWMAASDVFVLPSYMEGFGLVALEAMSCHTPVVGSNVGGLSTLLSNGAGVLIEPRDVTSLTNGLKKVIDNESLRVTLAVNGEIKANENDETLLIKRLIDIYDNCIHN